jgi:hypothetical protein
LRTSSGCSLPPAPFRPETGQFFEFREHDELVAGEDTYLHNTAYDDGTFFD